MSRLLILIALPFCQISNAMAYANARATWPGKVLTFATFLPVIAFTTTIWAALWAIVVWAAMILIK